MNVEYLTECYIKAYEKALEKTDDINVANNAATMVVTILANQLRLQNEATSNGLAKLLNSIAINNEKQATKSGRMTEDNKGGGKK